MKTTRRLITPPLLAAVLAVAVAGVPSRADATPADDDAAVKKLEEASVKADLWKLVAAHASEAKK